MNNEHEYEHDKLEYLKQHIETLANLTSYLSVFMHQYLDKQKVKALDYGYDKDKYPDIESYLLCTAQRAEEELDNIAYVLNASETEYEYDY